MPRSCVPAVILLSAAISFASLVACQSSQKAAQAPVDFGQRIVNADSEPGNWLSTGRNYQETRHSPLARITASNVGELGLAWFYDLDTRRAQEATPIVVDGVLYISSAWSKVYALDGVTGKLLWQFDPQVPRATGVKACCDSVNRGVAYWNGKVYVGALDGRLIAIDAKTGQQLWSAQTTDPAKKNTITGAPRVVRGQVVIGNGGADMGARGFVSAYDAETGKLTWRFYLVPGAPGQKDGAASDDVLAKLAAPTWGGEPQGGGGATAWDSFSYDPELDLLYIGTGNSSYHAQKYRDPNAGANHDNLFVGSVVAVRAQTGEYVWHYQETPGDEWDYTSTAHMILADLKIDGVLSKVLLHAPKNGFFYVLDRATGKLISAKAYGRVTWATGVDLASGRPIMNPEANYSRTSKVWFGYPAMHGAHDWQPMSYDAKLGLVFIPLLEAGMPWQLDPAFKPRKLGWNTGVVGPGSGPIVDDPKILDAVRASMKGWLMAWDPVKQAEVWRVPHPSLWSSGVLSTAGGLVFQGETEGGFNAYESATGRKLWSFDTQTAVMAAPVTWEKDGVQYVTVEVGSGAVASIGGGPLGVDAEGRPLVINRSRVLTFALGRKGALPPAVPPALREPLQLEAAGDAATVAKGRTLYHLTCWSCHGVEAIASDLVPDLRYSPMIKTREAFKTVVYDGALNERGMVSFKDNYSEDDVEQIRAYLVDRARAAAKKYGRVQQARSN